jgi:hypothetical protein
MSNGSLVPPLLPGSAPQDFLQLRYVPSVPGAWTPRRKVPEYFGRENFRRPGLPPTQQELDDQFVLSFSEASKFDPGLRAEIGKITDAVEDFGISPEEVRKNIAQYRRMYQAMQVDRARLQETNPMVYTALQDPKFAAVGWDKIEELGALEGLFSDTKKGVLRNWLGKMVSPLGYRDLSDEEWKQIAKLDKEIQQMGTADLWFLTPAATLAGQFGEGAVSALGYGLAGAGIGAGIGAAGGGVGAIPGATTGAIWGMRAGYAINSYLVNSGLAGLEMSKRGYNIDAIRSGMIVSGAGNMVLDITGAKIASRAFRGTKVGKFLDRVGKNNPLDRVQITDSVKLAAKDAFLGAAGETGTELLQTVNEMFAEELARRGGGLDDVLGAFSSTVGETAIQTFTLGQVSGEFGPAVYATEDRFDPATGELIVRKGERLESRITEGAAGSELWATFSEVAQGMTVLSGVGGAYRAVTADARNKRTVARTQEFFGKLQNAPAELAERAPDAFRAWMQEVARDSGAENVKISLYKLREKLALAGISEEDARQVIPEMDQAIDLERHLGDNVDVVIGIDRLKADIIPRQDLFEVLKPALRLDEDPLSFEEFQEREQAVEDERKRVREAAEQTEASEGFTQDEDDAVDAAVAKHNAEVAARKRVRAAVSEKVRRGGMLSGAEATAAIETVMGMLHAQYTDADVDIPVPFDQWFDLIGLDIVSSIDGVVQTTYRSGVVEGLTAIINAPPVDTSNLDLEADIPGVTVQAEETAEQLRARSEARAAGTAEPPAARRNLRLSDITTRKEAGQLVQQLRELAAQPAREGEAPLEAEARKAQLNQAISLVIARLNQLNQESQAAAKQQTQPGAAQPVDIPYDSFKRNEDGTYDADVEVSGSAPAITFAGRTMVIRVVNGVAVPFYLSTGAGGKAKVPAGKWYPFFGVSTDGWINKGSQEQILDYYGSPALRAVAEQLNAELGPNPETVLGEIPKVRSQGQHRNTINDGLGVTAVENEQSNTKELLNANIADVVARVEGRAPSDQTAAAEQTGQADAAAPQLDAGIQQRLDAMLGNNQAGVTIEDALAGASPEQRVLALEYLAGREAGADPEQLTPEAKQEAQEESGEAFTPPVIMTVEADEDVNAYQEPEEATEVAPEPEEAAPPAERLGDEPTPEQQQAMESFLPDEIEPGDPDDRTLMAEEPVDFDGLKTDEPVKTDAQGQYYERQFMGRTYRVPVLGKNKRHSKLKLAAQALERGEITRDQWDQLVDLYLPLRRFTAVPPLPSDARVAEAMDQQKANNKGNKKDDIGRDTELADGERTASRLDIPAYRNKGIYVVSVHKFKGGAGSGPILGYNKTIRLTNVVMGQGVKKHKGVVAGTGAWFKTAKGDPKNSYAVLNGNYVKATNEENRAAAEQAFDDPAYRQVGMNPERHGYWYDRESGEPIIAADEIIQIGELVLAKNPTYAPKSEFLYSEERVLYDERVEQEGLNQLDVQRNVRKRGTKVAWVGDEKQRIAEEAQKGGISVTELTNIVREHKLAHPPSDGWAMLVFKKWDADNGEPLYQAIPYTFHRGEDGKLLQYDSPEYRAQARALAEGMRQEVLTVYNRAQAGDENAQAIIREASWYREMRARLRREFGGLGDLFADLLGAASPNTPVRENWRYAVDVLRRATRGDWDEMMPQWERWDQNLQKKEAEFGAWIGSQLEAGRSKKDVKSDPEYKERYKAVAEARKIPDDLLPRKEPDSKGKAPLYGFNGKNIIRGLLGLWRTIKQEDPMVGIGATAPKAVNFSGNLIGFRGRATIDVWAARLLNRLYGAQRIPSRAESGVPGKMLPSGETRGAFGFGQDVFAAAAELIRNDDQMKQDPVLAGVNDDDLQAIVWFLEKEHWTANDWTSVSGEGGSFEYEADLTGSRQLKRIEALRKIAGSSVAATDQEKADAQAAMDAAKAEKTELQAELKTLKGAKAKKAKARVAELNKTINKARGVLKKPSPEQMQEERRKARAELDTLIRTTDRFQVGLSITTPDFRPADADQVHLADAVRQAALETDDNVTVLASKVASTVGRYGAEERSIDAEIVTREGYDWTAMWRKTLEIGRDNNQDSVFMSRVLRTDETYDPLRHRPGVEVFFREMGDLEQVQGLLDDLAKEGVEFYTVIVDGRRGETERGGAMGSAVGVRFQLVPEFEARYGDAAWGQMDDASIAAAVKQKSLDMATLAHRVASLEGVTFAEQLWYATEVAFAGQYDNKLQEIAAGQPEGQPGAPQEAGAWNGQSIREGVAGADSAADTSPEEAAGDPGAGERVDEGPADGDVDLELFSEEVVEEPRPIPDNPLAVIHRIGAHNLQSALDIGGLAAPSMGVTNPQDPYEGFGEVILVGTQKHADPEASVAVFAGDGWTPTFPHVYPERLPVEDTTDVLDLAVDIYKVETQHSATNNPLSRNLAQSFSQVTQDLRTQSDVNRLVDLLSGTPGIRIIYLKEIGQDVPMRKAFSDVSPLYDDELRSAIRDDLDDLLDEASVSQKLIKFSPLVQQALDRGAAMQRQRLSSEGQAVLDQGLERYKNLSSAERGEDAAKWARDNLADGFTSPDFYVLQQLEQIETDRGNFFDPQTGLLRPKYLRQMATDVHLTVRDQVADTDALFDQTYNNARFGKWVEKKLAPLREQKGRQVFKNREGVEVEATLENVTEYIVNQKIQNAEEFSDHFTIGSARAQKVNIQTLQDVQSERALVGQDQHSRQRGNLDHVTLMWQQQLIKAMEEGPRADRFNRSDFSDFRNQFLGELVSRKDTPTAEEARQLFEKMFKKAYRRIGPKDRNEMIEKLSQPRTPKPTTPRNNNLVAMMAGATPEQKAQMQSQLDSQVRVGAMSTFELSVEVSRRLRDMAVAYMEAKVLRPVPFNEMAGAIVPETYSYLADQLEAQGLQVFRVEDVDSTSVLQDALVQLDAKQPDDDRVLFSEEQQNDPVKKTVRQAKYVRRTIGRRITRTIELMEHRTVASIYHELGHVFFDLRLDALARQLNNPDGPQSRVLRETMLAFFEAMGIGPENGTIEERFAAWSALTPQEQIPYHEAIARNFEIYLSQGRAPTRRQKRLFQRLRAFMVSVYTNVAQRVNQIYEQLYGRPLFEISPEVQGAFDRMMAAESDINRELDRMREKTGEDLPDLDDREDRSDDLVGELDLPADDREEMSYEELEAEARDDAIDELQRQLLEDQKMLEGITARETSRVYAEARRARRGLKQEALEQLSRKRIHRLRNFLRSGTLIGNDGNEQTFELFSEEPVEDKPKPNTKLNSEQVRKIAPDIKLTELGGSMTSPQGMDISIAADLFGYESAIEMIEDLRSSQTLDKEVEAAVQQRMLEQYGNLATPEAVRDAVQMAIFNETRQRAVLARMKEATGLALPEDVTLQAARDIARDRVSKLALRDMLPAKFQGDAMRARREAFRHLKKGDNARAAQAFRAELLYNAMVREAGTQKNNAKQRIKTVEQGYALGREAQLAKQRDMRFIYVGRQLLNMIGLGPDVERSDEQVDQLRQYDPEFYIAHKDLIDLMRTNSVDNVLDLTGEQLRMALDMIESVYDRSRTSRQITIAGRQMDRDEVAQQLAQQLVDSGKASSSLLTDQTTEAKQKSWKWAERRAQMKRLEQAMMVLDGGQERGPFSRAIYDMLQQPQQEADKVLAQLFERLEGMMKLVQNLQSTAPREIAAPELGGYIFGLSRKGDNGSIHELVTMIANLGNVSNRDRLMAGFRWSEKDADGHYSIEPVLRFLNRLLKQGVITRDVFDLAQGIMDTFESIKPRFQQALMAVEGRYVREIQAEPFTVMIDGEPVTFAGGYVPMRYDPQETVIGRKQEDDQRAARAALNLSSSAAQDRTVNPGEQISLRLDQLLSTFQEHVRYAYVVPSVKRVRDLMQASNVQDVVGMDRRVPLGTLIRRMNPGLYGGSANSVIELALYRASTGTLHPALAQAGPWSRPLSALRRRVGSIIFSGNIKNALENFGALNTVLFSSLGLRWRYLLPNYNGRYTRLEEMRTESPQMYNRMMKGAQQIVAESFTPATLKERLSSRAAYLAPRVTQQMLEGMVWGAAKDQWLAEMRPDGISDKQAIEQAVDFANSKVRNNLGSGDLLDAPGYEGAYGELGRFLTSFTGWFAFKNQQFQLIWERFKNESGLARYGQFAFDVLCIHYLEFAFGSLLTAWLYGEDDLLDDEEKLEAMLIEATIFQPIRMALAAAVPIAGDMAGGAIQLGVSKAAKLIDEDLDLPSGRGVEAPRTGAFDFLAQRARTVLKALEGEYEGEQLRAAVELAAILFGYDAAMLPAMAGRQLEYGTDVMLGNTEPQSAEDVLRGVTTGRQPDNR